MKTSHPFAKKSDRIFTASKSVGDGFTPSRLRGRSHFGVALAVATKRFGVVGKARSDVGEGFTPSRPSVQRTGGDKPLPYIGKMQCLTRKSPAFTLIELLVVIAIIALLAGLLLPALNSSRDSAKKSKAQVAIGHLGIALKSYYNEYGYWPSTQTVPTADAELTVGQNQRLYQMLSGSNTWLGAGIGTFTYTEGGNPRGIVFYEFKASDLAMVDNTTYLKVTSGGTTNLVNPWNNAYRFIFDYDGNNTATNAAPGLGFAIWCVGTKNNIYTNMSWK